MRIVKFLFIACLFLCACNRRPAVESPLLLNVSSLDTLQRVDGVPERIDVGNAGTIDQEGLLQRVASVEYIPLDSSEPIGNIDKMIVAGGKIYVLDTQVAQQIFVYDRKGKLLFRIKDKGNGPEEYISLWDMQVDTVKNEILVDDALGLAYIYYSAKDGSFIRKEKAVQNCFAAKLGDYYVNILSKGQSFADKNWQLIISDRDSAIAKGFELKPIQDHDYVNNTFRYDPHDGLLFVPSYSDTIYRISPDLTYTPLYVICQEKSVWSDNESPLGYQEIDRLIKENGYTKFKGDFISSGAYTFFTIHKESKNFIANRTYVWNRTSGELFEWMPGTLGSETKDLLFAPICADSEAFYGTFIYHGEKNPLKNLRPELVSVLEKQTDDSNPIVVRFTFK